MVKVAFGVYPSNPAYSPIRYNNALDKVAGIDCCIDVDVKISGSILSNLISSPPDGSTRAEGAFTTIGNPVFSGTGLTAKYNLDSSDAIQILSGNTPCIERFHKTNASEPYWYAIIFGKDADRDGAIISTGDNNSDHGYVARRNATNDKLVVRNFNGSSQSLLANDNGVFPTATDLYLFIYTADPNAGDDTYWSNTRTGVVDTDTWVTTTTDATDNLTIGNVADLSEGWAGTGFDFYSFSCGLGYLSDTLAGDIIDHYNDRHNTTYA